MWETSSGRRSGNTHRCTPAPRVVAEVDAVLPVEIIAVAELPAVDLSVATEPIAAGIIDGAASAYQRAGVEAEGLTIVAAEVGGVTLLQAVDGAVSAVTVAPRGVDVGAARVAAQRTIVPVVVGAGEAPEVDLVTYLGPFLEAIPALAVATGQVEGAVVLTAELPVVVVLGLTRGGAQIGAITGLVAIEDAVAAMLHLTVPSAGSIRGVRVDAVAGIGFLRQARATVAGFPGFDVHPPVTADLAGEAVRRATVPGVRVAVVANLAVLLYPVAAENHAAGGATGIAGDVDPVVAGLPQVNVHHAVTAGGQSAVRTAGIGHLVAVGRAVVAGFPGVHHAVTAVGLRAIRSTGVCSRVAVGSAVVALLGALSLAIAAAGGVVVSVVVSVVVVPGVPTTARREANRDE